MLLININMSTDSNHVFRVLYILSFFLLDVFVFEVSYQFFNVIDFVNKTVNII